MSNWDPEKRTISQNSPYYAGGTHRNGTAWQVDSPILDLEFLTEKGPNVHDGQYGHISIGRYNSIFIGGVCHELGHALGLPHNNERADERAAFGTALMGSGNRTYGEQLRGESKGSFLTLAHGLRLASHPMFSGSVKGMNLAAPPGPTTSPFGRRARASSSPAGSPPIPTRRPSMQSSPTWIRRAAATTTPPRPPPCRTRTAIPLDCQALAPGKSAELRVVYLQANGVASGFLSATPYKYPYTVAADGTADISAAIAALKPVAPDEPAKRDKDPAAAKSEKP